MTRLRRNRAILRGIIATFLLAGPASAQSCLQPGAIKEIAGTLTLQTLPGPPNYQDTAKGDRAETGFYLKLDHPVCVEGAGNGPDGLGQTRGAVQFIQLLLSADEYPPNKLTVGMREGYSGVLVRPENAHHRTMLLLDEVRFLWIETR